MTDKVAVLGEGIRLSWDSRLQAEVRLASLYDESLDLDGLLTPALFRDNPESFQALEFTSGRGSETGLGVLELNGVVDHALVTAENPLVLTMDETPVVGETILPYAFDGEFFLPLGNLRSIDGRTEINIEHLPITSAGGDLESLGSITIMFQKIAADILGTGFDYPQLAVASVTDDGKVIYETGLAEMRRQVAEAGRILLYVHGLFGDSRGYVASAVAAEVADGGEPPKLAEMYDLILAFDYESVNTPIDLTARQLRQELEAVGLGPNHGKTLHIVAHSLGGLVSRWFVEQEGGKEIVQHLVTAGTPHMGTPWPKVHDWATTLLVLGLNGLSSVAWPVKIAASLLKATETIDVTVDQMDPNSTFMELLATNPDPGIPITLFAGNTSINPVVMQVQPGETSSRLERLLNRLEDMKLLEKAAGLAFFGQPNDIAVSVKSAFGLPDSHAQVSAVEIACDHMSFFLLSDSLKKLAEALDA